MPIKVQNDLPARAVLESENIFVMDEDRAMTQDIRPLQILILNLMPVKEDTETQLLRALSNTPLQVDCTFLMLSTHTSKNTSASHLNKFYVYFDEIRRRKFDGMIITGAPVENMEFEEVNYWDELTKIMEWSKTHVHSTLHICWGAQAGLYYHYGIPKYQRDKKLSGIYRHKVLNRKVPLVRSLDDYVMAPHSRYTEVRRSDIEKNKELQIVAESDEAGVFLVLNQDGSQIFVQGHPEYDRMSLNGEYHRDLQKGINPELPCNYYEDNDPFNIPVLSWRNLSNTLYGNWLNFYVYQTTDYVLEPDTDYRIILASGSPRRLELLHQVGINPVVEVSRVEENITSTEPSAVVMELSLLKAEDIASCHKNQPVVVIGADTVVAVDGEILGKPKSREEAIQMIEQLQGRSHQVYTGVTILYCGDDVKVEPVTFFEETQVDVYPMTSQEIAQYVATGEPMDKAGAYGIQGEFAAYISGIQGDYNTVVGLPVGRVCKELRKITRAIDAE